MMLNHHSIYLPQAERAIEEQITKLAAKRKEKGCEYLGLNLDTRHLGNAGSSRLTLHGTVQRV